MMGIIARYTQNISRARSEREGSAGEPEAASGKASVPVQVEDWKPSKFSFDQDRILTT
jgi:hypothetical protein